jgi:hypothetical protein
MALASGLAFHKLSNWSFDPRYPINFDYNKLIEGDTVFLNLDYFQQFYNVLLNSAFPIKKFILITHNSDRSFTNHHFSLIEKYVYRIYAINNECNNIKVVTIPIAFQDYPQNHFRLILEKSLKRNKVEKTNLLYMNFNIGTNPQKRQPCFDIFNSYDWVTKKQNVSKEEFMNDVLLSKYVLSPEGTGIDCHRIYEAIICGTIPIIKKSNTEMDKFYKKLPVMLIDDWNIITLEYLNQNYINYKFHLDNWLNKSGGWIYGDYWIQKLHLITFGDEKYERTKLRLKEESVKSKFFSSIKLYSPNNFESDFKHLEFIRNNRRGYGYWIWKMYFILKRLNEIQYNDILLYADAGCSINNNGKKRLSEYVSLLNDSSDNDILCFQMTHLEYKYTKNDIFQFFNTPDSVKNSGQFVGGVLFIRKTDRIMSFLKNLYEINGSHYNFLDDSRGISPNHEQFIDCRHDQSMFSVMMKQFYKNKVVIPEETWPPDNNWNSVAHVPILAKRLRY